MKYPVSVIMAAYNAAATIEASVRSVLEQSMENIELIVVDDGSIDETRAVLEGIDDPRIRVISQDNAGPSAARNRAVAEARGEFVACIDADDLWAADKIELQVQALRATPEASVAYGWVDIIDSQSRFAYSDQRVTHEGNVYAELLHTNFIFSGSNTMIRKSVFERLGGFDESLRAVEDWEFHVRLAAEYEFVGIPRVLVRYRQAPGSLSSRLDLMEASFVQAHKKIFDCAPRHLQHLKAHSAASFHLYMAIRSIQSGRGVSGLPAAVRFAIRAVCKRPAICIDVVRGVSPLASLRMNARGVRSRRFRAMRSKH